MRITGIYLFMITLLSQSCFAQSTDKMNYLNGMYSMHFSIDKDFDFNSFDGSNFSIKYNFSDNRAVRLGITTLASKNDIITNNYSVTKNSYLKNEKKAVSLGVNAVIMQRIRARDYTSMYVGIGPFINIRNSSSLDHRNPDTGDISVDSQLYEKEQKISHYGIMFIAGVEVFLKKYVSVFFEYGMNFNYFSTSKSYDDLEKNGTQEGSNYSLGTNPFVLGVSVYF